MNTLSRVIQVYSLPTNGMTVAKLSTSSATGSTQRNVTQDQQSNITYITTQENIFTQFLQKMFHSHKSKV